LGIVGLDQAVNVFIVSVNGVEERLDFDNETDASIEEFGAVITSSTSGFGSFLACCLVVGELKDEFGLGIRGTVFGLPELAWPQAPLLARDLCTNCTAGLSQMGLLLVSVLSLIMRTYTESNSN